MHAQWDSLNPEKIDKLTRAQCIELLAWNDPNGIYTDADSRAEGLPKLKASEARELLKSAVEEQG
jgi:hypothetical protein